MHNTMNKKPDQRINDLLKENTGLVRPDLIGKWTDIGKDSYSYEVINAAIAMMKALSEGYNVGAAYRGACSKHVKLGNVIQVAELVSKFYPKGKEFREEWNKYWDEGYTPRETETLEGVIDPSHYMTGPKE